MFFLFVFVSEGSPDFGCLCDKVVFLSDERKFFLFIFRFGLGQGIGAVRVLKLC